MVIFLRTGIIVLKDYGVKTSTTVIYLDWRLSGAADWRLFALAVDPPIL